MTLLHKKSRIFVHPSSEGIKKFLSTNGGGEIYVNVLFSLVQGLPKGINIDLPGIDGKFI